MSGRRIAGAMIVVAQGFSAAASAQTYEKDIALLIADRCVMCHHAGGPAPFSLSTYDDVKRHAEQIAKVTVSRYMPPWKVDSSNGPFIGQRPLSAREIDRIQQWVAAGASGDEHPAPGTSTQHPAPGTSTQHPAPSTQHPESAWQLGTPDLVVTLPTSYELQAEGTDVFRIFVLPIPVDRERYVRGLEFLPGNPKVVHHANIRIDRTPSSRALDASDPNVGYSGLILRSAEYPDGHFLGWTPGQVAPLMPSELSWRLTPQSDLVVEVHMQPSGKPESVRPSIGLYFGDRPPTRTPEMLRLGRQDIDIPAGARRYVVTDAYVLPVDVEVQALQPHAHYRLRQATGQATLPDGSTKTLLQITDWDFRWQHVYRYVTPMALPKGTKLSMEYVYDNSDSNPRNPQRPPLRARWGQRSSDEMGDLWIQVLTRTPADLVTLDAQFRRKVIAEDVKGYEAEIERHPADTGLRDSVAMLYLELNRPMDAARHFQVSVESQPNSATAHYNWATALSLGRRLDEAMREYQRALAIDPQYANAHNNLGNVLLAIGRADEAVKEFSEVVRLQPASASALGNLAAAYAAAKQFARALETVEAAMRMKPAEPLATTLKEQRDRYRQRVRAPKE